MGYDFRSLWWPALVQWYITSQNNFSFNSSCSALVEYF